MTSFRTLHARRLLQHHKPNMIAYLCEEIALEPNEENAVLLDSAYAELVELGYVEEMLEQRVLVYSGSAPRHPFRLTEEGLRVRNDLIGE